MSGWLICDKHGGQPPFHTCIHVKKAISLFQEIHVYSSPVFGAKICADCYKLYSGTEMEGLTFESILLKNEIEQNRFFELYEKIESKIPNAILCSKCINKELIMLECR